MLERAVINIRHADINIDSLNKELIRGDSPASKLNEIEKRFESEETRK